MAGAAIAVSLAAALAAAAAAQTSAAPAAPAATVAPGYFLYHARAGDTLIGLGKRLLRNPGQWPQIEALNRIANPRRIPPGSIIKIPYEWLSSAPEMATIERLAGTVEGAGKMLNRGDALAQGSVIVTGADGSCTIDLADGSVVTLQKSSSLTLDEMLQITGAESASSIRLTLGSGRLETAVKPHRDVGRFEIVTPAAVSAVRGTEFRDSFSSADDHATTETLEGTVAVAGSASAVAVPAGFGTRVDQGAAPLPPVVLLPPPDLSSIPTIQSQPTLRLDLPRVAGAQSYRVQLAEDPKFQALTADVLTSDGVVSIAHVPDGEYWLRARSIDRSSIEGTDAVTHVVRHQLPPPPQPVAPTNGQKITGAAASLAWSDAGAAVRYNLQVATEAAFAAPIVRNGLTTPFAQVDDLAPGTYSWRVATVNPHGEAGAWSEPRFFSVRAPMAEPDAPSLQSKALLIQWRPSADPSYRVQIARTADFEHPLRENVVTTPAWTTRPLAPGSYFVRVQGVDADGQAGAFGPARRFVVPVPLWVKIVVPLALGLTLLL